MVVLQMLGVNTTVLTSLPAKEAASDCVDLCAALAAACFVISVLADNYSQVDKLWSITPWVYIWVVTSHSNEDPRLLWMAFVTTVWGIRLTLNFNRRGGYQFPSFWLGEEDYRWAHVRKIAKANEYPVLWQAFNLGFICIYQHVLLMLLAAPALVALDNVGRQMDAVDLALGLAVLILVGLEAVADEQQYLFQEEKYRLINETGRAKLQGEYKVGFIRSGLWSLCRHPNYACEQAIWIAVFGFAYNLAGLNWSAIGAILLVALFYPSSLLSEWITTKKYPKYVEYQTTHCRFFPLGRVG